MQADDRNQIETAATQILHPASRQLFRYWEGLRAERPCPLRSEIALPRLVALMPNLSILEKSKTGQWTYRLAGTEVCNLMRQSMTGKNAMTGFDNFEHDVVSQTFDLAQSRLQPCLVRMRLITSDGRNDAAELLGLPVIDDNNSGDVQLFGGLFGFAEVEAAPSLLLRRELVSARMIWTEHESGNRLLDQVGRTARPRLQVIEGGLSKNGGSI